MAPALGMVRTVEIVGPPGAGKTSLLSALAARRPGLRTMAAWRRPVYLPEFARETLGLIPLFVAQWSAGRPLARRDMERLVRVQASRRIAAGWGEEVVLMDQGPIYTLATLRLGACGPGASERLRSWWDRMVQEWAGLLETVIYLEAEDDVLLSRIRGRSKDHRLKFGIEPDGLAWLTMLREALERTLDRFRERSRLTVLRFDTGREELPRIVDRVSEALERG
jgi:thymidylate kinase